MTLRNSPCGTYAAEPSSSGDTLRKGPGNNNHHFITILICTECLKDCPYVGTKIAAEGAGAMSPKPLNVSRAEDLPRSLGRTLAQLIVLSLVLAADAVATHRLHRLAEVGHARLLRRLGRDLLVVPGARAYERLQRFFR